MGGRGGVDYYGPIDYGGAKLKVIFASTAGFKEGRSVGLFRLGRVGSGRVGRSGRPESGMQAMYHILTK